MKLTNVLEEVRKGAVAKGKSGKGKSAMHAKDKEKVRKAYIKSAGDDDAPKHIAKKLGMKASDVERVLDEAAKLFEAIENGMGDYRDEEDDRYDADGNMDMGDDDMDRYDQAQYEAYQHVFGSLSKAADEAYDMLAEVNMDGDSTAGDMGGILDQAYQEVRREFE